MIAKSSLLAVLILVAAFGVAIYLPGLEGLSGGGIPVITSTTSTSCTSSTWTTGAPVSVNGTFSSTQQSQIRVDYVRALLYQGQMQPNGSAGPEVLQLELGFTNMGGSDVYVVKGCGSSLNFTILSGASVVQKTGSVRCLCAEGPSQVGPGQSATQVDPGCWSGYSYYVVRPGPFTAKLVLAWSGTPQLGSQGGTVTVTATFDVP